MTLKEQLDEKVKQERLMSLWEEIKNLFLCLDYTELTKDVSFRIFCINPNEPILYAKVGSKINSGKHFSQNYDFKTLESVMPICETNGINVERENNTSFKITYKP